MLRGEGTCCDGGNERAGAEATSFDVVVALASRISNREMCRRVAAWERGDANVGLTPHALGWRCFAAQKRGAS